MQQQKKIINNIIYSIIVQIAGFIAPLILSPYVARVLSPELIGDYSYTYANSCYFVLAESLGLTLYGTIKVAKIRDDKLKTSQFFWEIFWLKIILMIFFSLIYCLWFLEFGNQELKNLYFIMVINIIGSGIDTTWFLSGLEEFKITAYRSVLVRIANVILVICLVNDKKDLLIYALIMQGSILISYIVMYPSVFRHITVIPVKSLNLIQHLKPSMIYFVPGLINTIFSSVDKSVLGRFSTSFEVGVYEQANKICQLCMGIISAISNAIFPRAAYLSSNKKNDNDAKKLLYVSMKIAFMAALPVVLGIAAISNIFVPLFFGTGYEKSAILLKILCLNVLFVALSNFIGQQCLLARGKQKEHNISIIMSAVFNVFLNICLVHQLQSIGVSIASAISGAVGFFIALWYGKDMLGIFNLLLMAKRYILASIIMYFSVFRIQIKDNNLITILIRILVGGFVYFGFLYLLKDDYIYMAIKKLRQKILLNFDNNR